MPRHDDRKHGPLSALCDHPKVTLQQGPTPLEKLNNLSDTLGLQIWAKRDDCTGLAMGGNKVRQLEYYLGPGAKLGADTVLVTGARQSNFVRLTAAAAGRMGWRAVVQLEDRVPNRDPAYRRSGNVLLTEILGADIHHFPEGENEAAADENLDRIAVQLRNEGRTPYVIHLGLEHPPIGGLGYVEAAGETYDQFLQTDQLPDYVVLPSGSGLTHAGFLVGARAIGWGVPILGICVRRGADQQRDRILRRAREIVNLLGIDIEIAEEDVQVDDAVLAPGYGRLNAETRDAISLAAVTEALLLDPVYSGRCMAGLISMANSGEIPAGSVVLFLHTGGTPGLFAYQDELSRAANSP